MKEQMAKRRQLAEEAEAKGIPISRDLKKQVTISYFIYLFFLT